MTPRSAGDTLLGEGMAPHKAGSGPVLCRDTEVEPVT